MNLQAKIDDPQFMEEYLRFAVKFERNAYIWSAALNQVNSIIEAVCRRYRLCENNLANCRDKARTLDMHSQLIAQQGAGRMNKKQKMEYDSKVSSHRRQIILNNAATSTAEEKLASVKLQVITAADKHELVKAQSDAAAGALAEFYAEDVLPEKYRNFSAVATMYEYLHTGRCTIIRGHGGIFDTYEYDRKLGLIIENLVSINAKLDQIAANQRMLYDELREANRTLSGISSSLSSIEKSSAEIASNSAISAAADQRTADAAQWMKIRMQYS